MTSDPLDLLWQSPANQPAPAAGRRLAEAFVKTAQRRRRRQAWWLGWTLVALAAMTTLAAVQTTRAGAAGSGLGLLWLMLVLPWTAGLHFWREFRRERAVPAGLVLPLVAALDLAAESNRAERRRLRVIGALLVLMLPLAGLAIRDLHLAGKAAEHEAWSMAAVFAVGLGAGLTGVILRHRRLSREDAEVTAQRAATGPAAGS